MNRAQKAAWLGLIGGLITIIIVGLIGYLLLTGFPQGQAAFFFKFAVIPLLGTLFFTFVFFFTFIWRRKQSQTEPDTDERDKQISLSASRVCFISLCLLIYFSDAAIMVVTGLDGWIPSSALPVIHFAVGYIAFTIYYATVIILYSKGHKQPEGDPA